MSLQCPSIATCIGGNIQNNINKPKEKKKPIAPAVPRRSPIQVLRAWIHVLDAPSCYERAAWAERKSATTGLRISQNCRAVCTKKSGLGP